MTKYIANVQKLGCKTVIISANLIEEAYIKLIEAWGKENIITEPELPQSQAQIDSIECKWGID
jgi:hypothetical protein